MAIMPSKPLTDFFSDHGNAAKATVVSVPVCVVQLFGSRSVAVDRSRCAAERYLSVEQCAQRPKMPTVEAAKPKRPTGPVGRKEWRRNFDLKKFPKIWQTVEGSAVRTQESR
jgi:hypothetical protein